jgi:hypothetical protein
LTPSGATEYFGCGNDADSAPCANHYVDAKNNLAHCGLRPDRDYIAALVSQFATGARLSEQTP